MENMYDLIIVGAGPAGLATGLYSGRANLKTLLLEKEAPGGQMVNMDLVENYPGFDGGVTGPDLASNMMTQTINTGLELEMAEVLRIIPEKKHHVVETISGIYYTKAITIASGSHHRKLGVPGEDEFLGNGVFYCAVCDGGPYANKVVAVAGGGDSGFSEALYLARIASKVLIYEAMSACSASSTLQERARSNPKIEIQCGVSIDKISGDSVVKEITLADSGTGNKTNLAVDGVLIHIGVDPNSDWLKDMLPLNPQGQIIVDDKLQTGIPGIFAAGDVRASSPCQIVTAVGDGAATALFAQRYLNTIN